MRNNAQNVILINFDSETKGPCLQTNALRTFYA